MTVYERDEAGGGLVRFGVPDFKIEKWVVERRLDQLIAEGVRFEYGVDVGVDVGADELRERHDAVVIATGSRVPRDLPVPGRELDGVHYAMEYLYGRNRWVAGNGEGTSPITAAGKHVIVIGGGDTGADCVGNSHREGAASVTQIELLGEPPAHRPDDLTPWPRWPVKLRRSYAIKEGGEQDFAISTTKLTGSNGRVEEIHWVQNSGKPPFDAIEGTETTQPADLVLLAMGFLSPEPPVLEQLGVEKDQRGNAKAGAYATSAEGVFAAGDARRGQSLIVWAINEGRQCARVVDRYLNELPERDPREALTVGASERAGSAELGADPPRRRRSAAAGSTERRGRRLAARRSRSSTARATSFAPGASSARWVRRRSTALPFAEAVAWAREHADRAYADVEWERYASPDRSEGAASAARAGGAAARGRRRPVADAWRDRPTTPGDAWEIVVTRRPISGPRAPRARAVVERVAARLAAAAATTSRARDELDAASPTSRRSGGGRVNPRSSAG